MSKKFGKFYLLTFFCVTLSITFFNASEQLYGFDISIQVSPSTLNIQSESQWYQKNGRGGNKPLLFSVTV